MRGNTLVTGGSDGSVRVWSLEKMAPIHRLAAHDNSVTSLQFDDTRVVSGGSDGRVKVWDLKTGQLVRELTAPADAVWRVAFEEEKCVVMASRANRTIMEVCIHLAVSLVLRTDVFQVWSFSPPEEQLFERDTSLAQRLLSSPPRPLSAIEYRTASPVQDQPMPGLLTQEAAYVKDDVDMTDAGPSTAPPQATGPTFFHDDD